MSHYYLKKYTAYIRGMKWVKIEHIHMITIVSSSNFMFIFMFRIMHM